MANSIKDQITKTIKTSENILIIFKDVEYGTGYPMGADAIASSLVFYDILKKNDKNVDIVSPNFDAEKTSFKFFDLSKIKNEINSANKTKISIDIKKSGLKNFSYESNNGELNIYLEPKTGNINLDSLKHEAGEWPYDLIITFDCPDLKLLNNIYLDNKKLFDSVPIINIDHSPQNEHYGEINMVNIKKSSTCEVLWQIIEDSQNIDNKIINYILSGVIAKTKNFKHPNINPETLNLVGKLIKLGAKREDIVEKFYRTRKIEELKLWGRTLARIKKDKNILWSVLARADFIHCGAEEDVLPEAIHEIINTYHESDIIALVYESNDNNIKALIHSNKSHIKIPELNIDHPPKNITKTTLPYKGLIEAEKILIEKIKNSR